LVAVDTASRIDSEVSAIIEFAHSQAKQILEENINKLHELAKHLIEKETMTGEEFIAILNRSTN